MYGRIEKNYVDDPAIKKLSYFSTIVLLILLIILITLMLLKVAWLPSFIIAVIFLCFSVPIYYLLIIRPFFRVKERKNKSIKWQYNEYLIRISTFRRRKLVSLLKSYHIENREELQIIMNYYLSKIPPTHSSSMFSKCMSLCLSIISIVIIAINFNTGLLDYKILVTIVAVALVIFFVVVEIPMIFSRLKRTFFFANEEVYERTYEDLSIIYIYFDEYFKRS